MKNFILFFSFLISSFVFVQTKMVAHKSHSGKLNTFRAEDYIDNFGINPDWNIDSIKLLENNCVERVHYNHSKDTLCNHPYFSGQYTMDEIKSFYSERTKFIGFEKKFYNDSITKPTQKKNSFYLITILLFLGVGSIIVFRPIR